MCRLLTLWAHIRVNYAGGSSVAAMDLTTSLPFCLVAPSYVGLLSLLIVAASMHKDVTHAESTRTDLLSSLINVTRLKKASILSRLFRDQQNLRRMVRSSNPVGGSCGDGLVDLVEECDPGSLGGDDPCCSRKCKLRPTAACSPAHHPCCTHDCQIAPATHPCKLSVSMESEFNTCTATASFCSGVDPASCGQSPHSTAHAPDFTVCAPNSVCTNGTCLSYCMAQELKLATTRPSLAICDCGLSVRGSQRTDDWGDVCARCCEGNVTAGASCVAKRRHASNGRPCVFGLCSKRDCIRVENPEGTDSTDVTGGHPKGKVRLPYFTAWREVFRAIYLLLPLCLMLGALYMFVLWLFPLCFEREKEKVKNTKANQAGQRRRKHRARPSVASGSAWSQKETNKQKVLSGRSKQNTTLAAGVKPSDSPVVCDPTKSSRPVDSAIGSPVDSVPVKGQCVGTQDSSIDVIPVNTPRQVRIEICQTRKTWPSIARGDPCLNGVKRSTQ